MTKTVNSFEALLRDTQGAPDSAKWRGPTIDVADTMYLCKNWFEGYGINYTASDLVGMARLILAREWGWPKRERPMPMP
jgi:hypothetical protein